MQKFLVLINGPDIHSSARPAVDPRTQARHNAADGDGRELASGERADLPDAGDLADGARHDGRRLEEARDRIQHPGQRHGAEDADEPFEKACPCHCDP